MSKHLLYIEDDPGVARLLQKRLERSGYRVDLAPHGQGGVDLALKTTYDALCVDQNMPGMDGLEVITRLAESNALPPTIMITGVGDEQVAVKALKAGAYDYLVKDADGGYLELLPSVIEQVVAQKQLREEKARIENELRNHADELQKRNEDLDAFARMVAHDLRDPVAALRGCANMLALEFDALEREQVTEFLDYIVRSAEKMQSIIEALLLLSQVRTRTVECSPVDLGATVEDVVLRFRPHIARSGAVVVAPDAWPEVQGYRPWIEEVWANYLGNAIKYGGEPPKVEFGFDRVGSDSVCLWIQDNGRGLTEEQMERVFQPFTRCHGDLTDGHGLGLSIVYRIVTALGGQVAVESDGPGAGSTFSFTLPAVGAAGVPHPEREALKGVSGGPEGRKYRDRARINGREGQ